MTKYLNQIIYNIVGDNMKKVLISILIAVLIGSAFAFMFYKKMMDNEQMVSSIIENSAYAIQLGVFQNIDNANTIKDKYNGIIITDNDKYRVYGAIAMSTNALTILKNYFNNKGISYYVKQIEVPDSLVDTIKTSETMLSASSEETYDKIIESVLKEYEKLLI